MRTVALFLALLATAPLCWGHGGEPPPPPEPPRVPPAPPNFGPPPGPPRPPLPDYDPTRPPTGTPVPPPPEPTPITPGEIPLRPSIRPGLREQVRTRARTVNRESTWRLWWEYNREHLVGLRRLLRSAGTVTGRVQPRARDPLGERRTEVLDALRTVALKAEDRTLRAAALLALGRMGNHQDGRLFVRILHERVESGAVLEAAAVALGVLPGIDDPPTADGARELLVYSVRHPETLPARVRGLALLSAGLRSRHDPALLMALIGRVSTGANGSDEVANLALACGFSNDVMAVPELMRAVRRGVLGPVSLSDVGRSHAAQALARIADPNAASTLSALLISRQAGIQSRRAAALSLGRLLREEELGKTQRERALKALRRAFEKDSDPFVRGFVAVALGGARPPEGVPLLKEAIDHGGNAQLKPFCALALGLAARTLGEERSGGIRTFLAAELDKTNAVELASSLSIALGLAGAKDQAKVLLVRLAKTSLGATQRGAAAQGLGLMGTGSPEVADTLHELAVKETSPELVSDVVLALGLLGRRSVAADLAKLLESTTSSRLQGRIALALAHLDHAAAVGPLLSVLRDKNVRSSVREFAAVALGILGDRRGEDLLFEIDAYFNYHATTAASNELVRLY